MAHPDSPTCDKFVAFRTVYLCHERSLCFAFYVLSGPQSPVIFRESNWIGTYQGHTLFLLLQDNPDV